MDGGARIGFDERECRRELGDLVEFTGDSGAALAEAGVVGTAQ